MGDEGEENGLAIALGRAAQIVAEVTAALKVLLTIALEEGLLLDVEQVPSEHLPHVAARVDQLVAMLSPEARIALVQVVYLTGDDELARALGVQPHQREEAGRVH